MGSFTAAELTFVWFGVGVLLLLVSLILVGRFTMVVRRERGRIRSAGTTSLHKP
jgi:hypothetical protein